MNHPEITAVIEGSDNIFEDLGFDPAEAASLAIRSDLLLDLRGRIQERGWSSRRSAEELGVELRRIDDLLSGHVDQFRIDDLVNMLARCGIGVRLEILAPAA